MDAVAIAVRPGAQKQLALLFESVPAAADRLLKVFGNLQTAQDWLDTASLGADCYMRRRRQLKETTTPRAPAPES